MMKTRPWRLALFFLLCLVLMPVSSAQADMGPKPTMSFEFAYDMEEPLGIVEGTLLQCEDPACADAASLEEMGPQGFSCTVSICSSMAYGYATYGQLVMVFTDGVTRSSDVFTKEYYQAEFMVTVGETDLRVEELEGKTDLLNIFTLGGVAILCVVGLFYTAAAVLFIFFWRQEGVNSLSFQESPVLYLLVSLLAAPLILMASIFAKTIFLTLLIEVALALLYAGYRKRSRLTWATICLLANLLTQPLLWYLILAEGGVLSLLVIVFELLIVLIEAGVLYATQRKTLKLGEALLAALILNLASLAVGLLLPV